MKLPETKNYSVESIRTILDIYMEKNKKELYKQLEQESTLLKFQIAKATEAMKSLLSLMEQGFSEVEAWEIVSKEIVYF
ncbi:MAG: hypothetical protein PHR87_06005 [Sulfurospirillaceae bacterium]|nr:hypothetical protein [Sulfurospirillaceae bacterium]